MLAITTSPGMPPMLEGFTLRAREVTVHSSLAKPGASALEQVRAASGTHSVPAGTYFAIQAVGTEVHGTFLPGALGLLQEECTVEWVDWYRR